MADIGRERQAGIPLPQPAARSHGFMPMHPCNGKAGNKSKKSRRLCNKLHATPPPRNKICILPYLARNQFPRFGFFSPSYSVQAFFGWRGDSKIFASPADLISRRLFHRQLEHQESPGSAYPFCRRVFGFDLYDMLTFAQLPARTKRRRNRCQRGAIHPPGHFFDAFCHDAFQQ